jgi:uncharacterized protein YegP (UPF0339 family)
MMFHIYHDVRNEWRWYLTAPNGARIAASGEGYARRGECVLAIARLKQAVDAPLMYDNIGPVTSLASSGLMASSLARA